MSDDAGVNPLEAMSEAEEAEALAQTMALLGTHFETATDALMDAVSEHVAGGLEDYGLDTMTRIRQVAGNGINLAQNVQGADLAITGTDGENAEGYLQSREALDIRINF